MSWSVELGSCFQRGKREPLVCGARRGFLCVSSAQSQCKWSHPERLQVCTVRAARSIARRTTALGLRQLEGGV
jgi:hypothetical protein